MSAASVTHVLGLLRQVRKFLGETANTGNGKAFIARLGGKPDITNVECTKILAVILYECYSAIDYIRTTDLSDDMKAGLVATTTALIAGMSPENLNNQLGGYIQGLDTSIGAFAMIVHATAGSDVEVGGSEIDDLISELAQVREQFDASDLAPSVKTTAKIHISILETMLRNISVVGIDAALSAYYDLVIHLRRESKNSPDPTGLFARIWGEVEKWAGRLEIIESLFTHGQNLIETGEKIVHALPHFPSLGG